MPPNEGDPGRYPPPQYGAHGGGPQWQGGQQWQGGPQNMPPMPPQHGSPPQTTTSKGFFGALFDFSFEHVVTPKIVKVAYILAAIVIALLYIIFTVAAFTESVAGGFLVMIIIGPLIALVYLVLARITLEFYRALVVMAADIREMKNAQTRL